MTDINERTSVLEVKVENIETKLVEFKQEVKEDNKEIKDTLKLMAENSTKQHKELGEKLNTLENKNSWVNGLVYALGPIAMYILTQVDWKTLLK